LGHETFLTGGKILTDILKNTSPDVRAEDIISKHVGDAVSKHVTESTQRLICKLRAGFANVSDGKRRLVGEAKNLEKQQIVPV